MLIHTVGVFARAVQIERTERLAEIDRVAVELRVGVFELIELGEMRAESVAAEHFERTLVLGYILYFVYLVAASFRVV